MPIRSLPARPSLELDKKNAKRLLREVRANEPAAVARIAASHPRFVTANAVSPSTLRLADVELVLAREYGFPSWPRYKHFVEAWLGDQAARAATLTQAVCSNQLARGVALLERDAQLARFDFYTACACGELAAVERALTADPSLAKRAGGPNGWQPLVYACFSRFLRRDTVRAAALLAIARQLLALGADPNGHYVDEHDGRSQIQTCLFAAAGIANNEQLTRLLLEAGANVNELVSPSQAGKSPLEALYHASEFKDVGCLRLLLEAKPDPASVSYCLGRALDFDNEPAARLFLEHGADPRHVVPWLQQRSHLHKAVLNRRSATIIRAMLERGADPSLADATGTSAYQYSVRQGSTELVALFEEFGATAQDSASETALLDAELLALAARRNDAHAITHFIKAGVDVNAALELPPLHAACYAGHLAAARLLVAAGADIARKSAYGGTPLGTCIYGSANCCDDEGGPGTLLPEEIAPRDYVPLVEWLLEQGAELPRRIEAGSDAVQEVLRRHGVPDAP